MQGKASYQQLEAKGRFWRDIKDLFGKRRTRHDNVTDLPKLTRIRKLIVRTTLFSNRGFQVGASSARTCFQFAGACYGMPPDREIFLQISLSCRSEYKDSATDLY
jgi:hypothetical protein